MPAYNAASTLEDTFRDIPEGAADHVILVDDASRDETAAIAERLGIEVIVHPENRGYGANQKTCYRAALERRADIVVMLHPDGQYAARLIPHFVGFVREGVCDVMLGSRIRTRREALEGGMPLYKYLMNRALTILMNVALGQNLGECHSGFRVYRREVLETVPFENNADDFSFDAEMLVQAAHFGFRLGDAPMPVRYFPEASSIGLRDSLRYGTGILRTLAAYGAHRLRLRNSSLFCRP
ncbi:MAG: glycosyltransferase family 2 protein [Gammaproteobacteria bacterium]|nr:MAG: glycosyltransferase family 2 protein [Gammaproteobacteria bacterium]